MYFKTLSEEKRQKEFEEAKQTAGLLSQLSSLMKSQRFVSWLLETGSRFEWASEKVLERLNRDLKFQLRQAIDDRSIREMGYSQQFLELSSLCEAAAERIEVKFGFKLKAKDKKFVVPRGEIFSDCLYAFLSRSEFGFAQKSDKDFYLWNAISSLVMFTRARDTLSNDTGNQRFEAFLASLDSQYMVDGYPHDILTHDAHLIRSNQKVELILANKAYCSTYAVQKGEQAPVSGDTYREIRIGKAA